MAFRHLLFFIVVVFLKEIKLVFDDNTLVEYEKHYSSIHPKAKKKPIEHPYHESINVWMIMKRPMMNALKQRWKDFIVWFIDNQGYSNLHIEKCELSFTTYYSTHRRHDVDNSNPKFLIDGLVESGFIVDDSSDHVSKIILECAVDANRPRTEILVKIQDTTELKEI